MHPPNAVTDRSVQPPIHSVSESPAKCGSPVRTLALRLRAKARMTPSAKLGGPSLFRCAWARSVELASTDSMATSMSIGRTVLRAVIERRWPAMRPVSESSRASLRATSGSTMSGLIRSFGSSRYFLTSGPCGPARRNSTQAYESMISFKSIGLPERPVRTTCPRTPIQAVDELLSLADEQESNRLVGGPRAKGTLEALQLREGPSGHSDRRRLTDHAIRIQHAVYEIARPAGM